MLIFCFFFQNKDGLISTEDVGTIARCIGKDLSEAEIQEVVDGCHPTTDGQITKEELVRVIEELIKPRRTPPMNEISMRK